MEGFSKNLGIGGGGGGLPPMPPTMGNPGNWGFLGLVTVSPHTVNDNLYN